MEQPRTLLNKGNPQILSSLENRLIVITACRTSDVFDTTASSPVDIVDEWELSHTALAVSTVRQKEEQTYESVTAHGNTGQFLEPFFPLVVSEWRRHFREVAFVVLFLELRVRRHFA